MRYRPELDGLRGVAILLVLAGHTIPFPTVKDGGKTGVAVFFTLSGYLITSLLLNENARNGRISLRRFYLRRFRRLAPAQLTAVAVFASVCFVFFPVLITWPQLFEAVFYVKNFRPNEGVFGHFWSLAVEEQFYLLWAPLVVLLTRRFTTRAVLLLAISGAVACWELQQHFWTAIYGPIYLQETLPLMGSALLIGCALAAFEFQRGGGPSEGWAWTPYGCVVFIAVLHYEPVYNAEIHFMPLVGAATALVIWGAKPTSWLALRPLRWFGQRSYAIYLWHYPIGLILYVEGVGWIERALIVVPSSMILAEISWHLIETRFHRWAGAPRASDPTDTESRRGLDTLRGVAEA